ncbi:MAG: hypothetical protein IJ320_06640 [Phascolarctobacterium sp.]|nr:hypothetical protein [Phascolarctobacterium sp.]
MSNKKSGKEMASFAAKILRAKDSSNIQKELAGSVLSQRNTNKVTGKDMESKASNVLNSDKYSKVTKSLAGSVLSQSKKDR